MQPLVLAALIAASAGPPAPLNRIADDLSAFRDAFLAREDVDALAHGERLLRLYSAEAGRLKQVSAAVEQLRRRKTAGTLGKVKPARPEGFGRWPVRRRIAHLIDALEDTARPDPKPLQDVLDEV